MSFSPPRRRVVAASARRPELRAVRVIFEDDPDPDASFLEQEDFEDRLKAYKRGEFGFVGVRVEAQIRIAETEQTLTSPGVWGIESDHEDGRDEIVSEEWKALRDVLKAVGVSTEQLPLEVDPKWVEWRT